MPLEDILSMRRVHPTLVGIDSDGCVFDTMRVKQRDHFHPLIIEFWSLEACADQLRTCSELVNLHSRMRGSNRFVALLKTFELLRNHPVMMEKDIHPPKLSTLRTYVHSGLPLGNPSLRQEVERTHDPELTRVLEWSLAVNVAIETHMRPVPPFPSALQALKLIGESSDALVVSQTPYEALEREWREHRIAEYVNAIAGQEVGSKERQLRAAMGDFYAPHQVVMIGDALGDLEAARKVGAHFYPIIPESEEESWARFCDEAYPKFLDNDFSADYELALQNAFESKLAPLPDYPPWHGLPARDFSSRRDSEITEDSD